MVLPTETKNTLAEMDLVVTDECIEWETTCIEWENPYPVIQCEKWKDEKAGLCEVWIQPKECLDFDKEKGLCLKWDLPEPKCIKEQQTCIAWETVVTPIGISDVNIIPLAQKGCYNFISEPMLHRYNTCIGEKDPLAFVEEDLKQIASNIEAEKIDKGKKPDQNKETIEVKIK